VDLHGRRAAEFDPIRTFFSVVATAKMLY